MSSSPTLVFAFSQSFTNKGDFFCSLGRNSSDYLLESNEIQKQDKRNELIRSNMQLLQ